MEEDVYVCILLRHRRDKKGLSRNVKVCNLVGVYTSELLVNFIDFLRSLLHVAMRLSNKNGCNGN